MDSQLSVVISSPTHTPHKFTLELSRQCTILELKEIIVTRLDTKLTIADQRLIFGGRILDDKDSLDRVFEKVTATQPHNLTYSTLFLGLDLWLFTNRYFLFSTW